MEMIMPDSKRRIRIGTVAIGLLMFLSGCGGGGLSGDIASGSSFCAALQDFSEFDSSGVGFGDDDSLEQVSDGVDRLLLTLPDDAPGELRQVLGATSDAVDIMKRTGADIDPADLSARDLAELQQVMQVFERVSPDASNAWMQNTCPGVAGLDVITGSALGGSSSSSSESAQSAPAPVPTATPIPTPTPTPIPVVTEEVLADGNAENFRDRIIDVAAITQTNGTVETFFGQADEADGIDRLFVEVFAQTNDFAGTMPVDAFILQSADGRTTAASSFYDVRGDRMSEVRLDERDSADFFVAFELSAGFDSADATILYGNPESVPAVFPLDGVAQSVYPAEIKVPEPIEFPVRSRTGQCQNLAASYRIESAEISLDHRSERGDLSRAPKGQRAMNLFGTLENVSQNETGCSTWLHYTAIDLRLVVDGVPVAGEVHRSENRNFTPPDAVDYTISFEVPADAERVELVNEEGTVLGTWDLALTPLFGEPDYTSPPASPSGVLVDS